MSDVVLVAVIAGIPGIAGLAWQIIRTLRGEEREEERHRVALEAEQIGLLDPLRQEISALNDTLGTERDARAQENMRWARECARLTEELGRERIQRQEDVARLQAEIDALRRDRPEPIR